LPLSYCHHPFLLIVTLADFPFFIWRLLLCSPLLHSAHLLSFLWSYFKEASCAGLFFLCFQPETKVTKRMKEETKNRVSSKKKERERNYLHLEKNRHHWSLPNISAKYRTNQALLKTSFY